MMNFYNAKELVAVLTAPPFAFNTPGAAKVVVEGNEHIKIFGSASLVEDAVRSLTDPRSTHARHFSRHKTFFQPEKMMKEETGHSVVLAIGSRRKW